MKAIFAALISIRGLSGLVGALLLSTLIWLFAPALLGTELLVVRILLTAVPIVVWLVALVVLADASPEARRGPDFRRDRDGGALRQGRMRRHWPPPKKNV